MHTAFAWAGLVCVTYVFLQLQADIPCLNIILLRLHVVLKPGGINSDIFICHAKCVYQTRLVTLPKLRLAETSKAHCKHTGILLSNAHMSMACYWGFNSRANRLAYVFFGVFFISGCVLFGVGFANFLPCYRGMYMLDFQQLMQCSCAQNIYCFPSLLSSGLQHPWEGATYACNGSALSLGNCRSVALQNGRAA